MITAAENLARHGNTRMPTAPTMIAHRKVLAFITSSDVKEAVRGAVICEEANGSLIVWSVYYTRDMWTAFWGHYESNGDIADYSDAVRHMMDKAGFEGMIRPAYTAGGGFNSDPASF